MTINKLLLLLKHHWFGPSSTRRAIAPAMLERLTQRVAASESHHTGQIRICVEAALPLSYLWRLNTRHPLRLLTRQRAIMMFGKLRVWDTANNNGVLIYLQLAERAIEVVADRGLSQHVNDAQWQAMIARMRTHFQQSLFEDGLMQALEEVTALLVTYFPAAPGSLLKNELPDQPFLG
jgi:uncharacterized membrane protein